MQITTDLIIVHVNKSYSVCSCQRDIQTKLKSVKTNILIRSQESVRMVMGFVRTAERDTNSVKFRETLFLPFETGCWTISWTIFRDPEARQPTILRNIVVLV